MAFYESNGDLDDDWCGVTADEREAVTAAIEGREDKLFALDVWELEDAALALQFCHAEKCRSHDDQDARALIESVLHRRDL